ncbi:hypothetical protein [Burkholderia ubonensis]|uniref:hypothetical protein n=1 Tax=Burkholderia ubonensis TaxID=101571 RepID=UPI0018DFE26B|nr:hypothetical protein [Burkholderia ubonensis]
MLFFSGPGCCSGETARVYLWRAREPVRIFVGEAVEQQVTPAPLRSAVSGADINTRPCLLEESDRVRRIIPTEDDQFVPLDTPPTADGFCFPFARIPHLGEYRTYTALAITHMIADSLNQFHRIHPYIANTLKNSDPHRPRIKYFANPQIPSQPIHALANRPLPIYAGFRITIP